ncbi:hypothetical protein JCM10449v2_004508 [Rhodotorula kratochvilovae]
MEPAVQPALAALAPPDALSTGPATPRSRTTTGTIATSPLSTAGPGKAAGAQEDAPEPMQVDGNAPDAPAPAESTAGEPVVLASIPLSPVGPFSLSPDKLAKLKREQRTGPPAASTSEGKRPLDADSSPAKSGAQSVDKGKGAAEPPKKRARKSAAGPKAVTQYCHQDHQPHDISKTLLLRCTGQKVAGKPKPGSTEVPMRTCSLSYCERCLSNRYGEDVKAVKASGGESTWKCPSCRGECNCSSCRKKSGLDATGPLKELGVKPGATDAFSAVGPVTGGRSAAAAARSKMSAGFTASGKVAAMSLTHDGPGSSPAGVPNKGKAKKAQKAKPARSPNGALSDSSLSELTDSDEEQPATAVKPKGKGKAKAASGSPAPAGSAAAGPAVKRAMPPRPPRDLPAPPRSHVLASVWAPSPTLPCDESLRARLHVREFFLRFLTVMPPLDPTPSTSSSKTSSSRASTKAQALSPHLARVLSALSDDVLWLWRDRDAAAEAVQLRLLQGVCELLLREKAYTGQIHKLQRENLDDLRVEVRTALAGVQRHREVFDRPWRTAKLVAEGGLGSWWVEEGPKWQKDAVERRERAEAARRANGGATASGSDAGGSGSGGGEGGGDGDESELSSIASSDDEDKADGDDDDEVDQLASDYEEPLPKLDKAGRRMKGERDMPGEERLAVICALVELASGTEAVRAEIQQGVDTQYTEQVALRKKRADQRRDLPAEKARLEASKPEKPAGNGISVKVKEWQDECDAIDEKIKQASEDAVKQGWQLQHEFFLAGAQNRVRFASIGTDAHGTEYYTPAPPPHELLESSAGAQTSGFPLDRKPSDDGVRDYPLSWCVIGHGRRPAAAGVGETKKEEGGDAAPTSENEWFVVRGLDDLDALAEWVDLSARHADHALRLAQFQLEHPKTKTGGVVRPPPSKAELAALEQAADRTDAELPDRLKQFADAMKWRREAARREKEGEGAMAERTRAHKA